jgi:hypothetical protein
MPFAQFFAQHIANDEYRERAARMRAPHMRTPAGVGNETNSAQLTGSNQRNNQQPNTLTHVEQEIAELYVTYMFVKK